LFGGSANLPSRFLQDISPHLVNPKGLGEEESLGALVNASSTLPPRSNALDLRLGDCVRHSKFGDGIVMDCLPDKGDQVLTVAFRETGVKKLLLSLAQLEKIEKDLNFPP